MNTGGRAASVADRLLDDIVAGSYPPGSRLPTEPELCRTMGVSRATVREAMKSLQQRGVTSIEQGRGTFVNPLSRWSPFDPVLLAARTSRGDAGFERDWSAKLLELRAMVEVGVAGLAAQRRDEADLADMRDAIDAMAAAGAVGHVGDFASADLAFHQAVMRAAGNELIGAIYDPIMRLIHEGRVESSTPVERRSYALDAHRAILDAIARRDQAAAVEAMGDHLHNTLAWLASRPGPPADVAPELAAERSIHPQRQGAS